MLVCQVDQIHFTKCFIKITRLMVLKLWILRYIVRRGATACGIVIVMIKSKLVLMAQVFGGLFLEDIDDFVALKITDFMFVDAKLVPLVY